MRSYESILECHWLDLNSINHHIIIWIKMIKIDWISSFLKPLLAVDILSSPRSFGGLACYGRCLRKGLGHLGWNPNIGMIIPRLYRWCLVHKSPKIVQTQNKWWCWIYISKNCCCYLNVLQFKRFKLMVLQYCFIHILSSTHQNYESKSMSNIPVWKNKTGNIPSSPWPLSPSMRLLTSL